VSGLDKIGRHRATHVTESDKSNGAH